MMPSWGNWLATLLVRTDWLHLKVRENQLLFVCCNLASSLSLEAGGLSLYCSKPKIKCMEFIVMVGLFHSYYLKANKNSGIIEA